MKPTSLARERDEQARWRLRPNCAGMQVFDGMVATEFRDPDALHAQQDRELASLLAFASRQVPYYRALFERLKIDPHEKAGFRTLQRLPILTKQDVQQNESALQALELPSAHKTWGWFRSSGTTGRATRVLHSVASNLAFSFLVQRQFRWFRWDPRQLRAEIRTHTLLPPRADGRPQRPGAACRQPAWRYAGRFFETGPQIGLCVTNPVDGQLAWLLKEQPAYLTANASIIDRLAWYAEDKKMPASLLGTHAISEQMTSMMRQRIQRIFQAPVDENYGLNEIGIVALRCHAGRFHVQVEHCAVEILDDDGAPVGPGTVGRLVVTALNNLAMPLLRYETGDLAQPADTACPCGRSLPAFAEIVGRYRRLAGLPADTMDKILALKVAVRDAPMDVGQYLQEYQIHQRSDGSYDLLLHVPGDPLPATFDEWMQRCWSQKFSPEAPPLRLVVVTRIPASKSGKPQEFVSDFSPL